MIRSLQRLIRKDISLIFRTTDVGRYIRYNFKGREVIDRLGCSREQNLECLLFELYDISIWELSERFFEILSVLFLSLLFQFVSHSQTLYFRRHGDRTRILEPSSFFEVHLRKFNELCFSPLSSFCCCLRMLLHLLHPGLAWIYVTLYRVIQNLCTPCPER